MRNKILKTAILATALVGMLFWLAPAASADTGTLKLKVRPCYYTNWLEDAEIYVEIYRPGEGVIDSATDYTDENGYVAITFEGLEAGDQAHVTVTPEGMSADDGHTYYWVEPKELRSGHWDLEPQSESLCEDGWYDEESNIILCLYQ